MSGHLDDDALVDLSLAAGAGTGAGGREGHLAACPSCSARLASFDRVVAAARPGPGDVLLQPPPHLWARVALEAGVPAGARTAPVAAARADGSPTGAGAVTPLRRRRLPALLAAAAAVGLVVGVGVTWLAVGGAQDGGDEGPDDGARVVAEASLRPFEGVSGSGRAEVDRTGDVRHLVVDARLPEADQQYYEVWLIDPDDGRLVSLGVLPPGEHPPLSLALPAGVDLDAYRTVDVSLESTDGDPGHSGTSVLRGTLDPRV